MAIHTECGDFLLIVALTKVGENQHNFMFCGVFCTILTTFGQRYPGNNEYIQCWNILISDGSGTRNRIFGCPESAENWVSKDKLNISCCELNKLFLPFLPNLKSLPKLIIFQRFIAVPLIHPF